MPARPATVDDIPEVLRLAALMYLTIGQRADEDWFREAGRLLEAWMGEGRTGVFVADAEEPGRLASCVAATIHERLPGPRNPAAKKAAYVQWMCTDPGYRRPGLGRAVLAALLDWLWAHGVSCIELHATAEGDPLYRSFGFEDPAQPQLRLFGPSLSSIAPLSRTCARLPTNLAADPGPHAEQAKSGSPGMARGGPLRDPPR